MLHRGDNETDYAIEKYLNAVNQMQLSYKSYHKMCDQLDVSFNLKKAVIIFQAFHYYLLLIFFIRKYRDFTTLISMVYHKYMCPNNSIIMK